MRNIYMEAFLQEAKASSRVLSTLSGAEKNRILKEMAEALRANTEEILKANAVSYTHLTLPTICSV